MRMLARSSACERGYSINAGRPGVGFGRRKAKGISFIIAGSLRVSSFVFINSYGRTIKNVAGEKLGFYAKLVSAFEP